MGSDVCLTSEMMRQYFSAIGLTYHDVHPNDIMALEGFLEIEYAKHSKNYPRGQDLMLHPCFRKRYETEIEIDPTGGIRHAFLFVSGSYFQGREAISFNDDGFIGFAGWASSPNQQPFLSAFRRWIEEWMVPDD